MKKIELLILVCIEAVSFFFIGIAYEKEHFQPQIIEMPVEKIVTQNVTQYVDREVIKWETRTVYKYYDVRNSDDARNTLVSVNEALSILTLGKASHAYMVLHPELQNASTGNMTYNLEWMDNYDKVSALLQYEANRILDLLKEKDKSILIAPPTTPPVPPPVIP